MSDLSRGERLEKLLTDLTIQAAALRDMAALLLALHARSTGSPDGVFREVSAGLDRRLDSMKVVEPDLVPHLERIRGEFDWYVSAARAMLGQV